MCPQAVVPAIRFAGPIFCSQWGSPEASHIKANQPHFPHLPCFGVRIFRVSCVFALRHLPRPLFFWGERDRPHFSRIGFELLISKIRPTGFIVTGLRWLGHKTKSSTSPRIREVPGWKHPAIRMRICKRKHRSFVERPPTLVAQPLYPLSRYRVSLYPVALYLSDIAGYRVLPPPPKSELSQTYAEATSTTGITWGASQLTLSCGGYRVLSQL